MGQAAGQILSLLNQQQSHLGGLYDTCDDGILMKVFFFLIEILGNPELYYN
jgi:hypothetical protein